MCAVFVMQAVGVTLTLGFGVLVCRSVRSHNLWIGVVIRCLLSSKLCQGACFCKSLFVRGRSFLPREPVCQLSVSTLGCGTTLWR